AACNCRSWNGSHRTPETSIVSSKSTSTITTSWRLASASLRSRRCYCFAKASSCVDGRACSRKVPCARNCRQREDPSMQLRTSSQKPAPERSASGHDLRPLSEAERAKLAADLTPEERRVILHQGTEPPFCGTLLNNKQAGMYVCRLC